MKIAICGSIAFAKEMVDIAKELKQGGHKAILPRNTEKYADGRLVGETSHESIQNKTSNDLIRNYFKVIKDSDAILVVNLNKDGIVNYIGGNSFLEMGFAHILGKPIFLLNKIPEMSYNDEIKAMQPIVIDNNLSKIRI